MLPMFKKPQNFVKNCMLPMLKKTSKFEGFDRESNPRPFQTISSRSDFFCFIIEPLWIALTFYGIKIKITNLDLF